MALATVGTLRARVAHAAQALRHDGIFWRRLAYAGAAYFPEWWRRYTPPLFGSVFWALLPRHRTTVADNQSRLLGLPRGSMAAQRAAHAVFVQYAQCLTDSLEQAAKPERPFAREIIGAEHMHAALARKRGVILVTAHTGSWEIGGRLLALDESVPVTMVMARESNEAAREYAEQLRTRTGIEVVYASGNDPATALTLLSRLRAGGVVAIQLDRAAPSGNVIPTRLCGMRWMVPEGPFRLAQGTGAPVVPVFVHRSGYRHYTLTVYEPITIAGRERAAIVEAAQRATDAFARFVREHPDQWFHFAPMPGE